MALAVTGHLDEAEAELRAVRVEVLRENLGFPAAIVSLDLIAVSAAKRRPLEVQELAQQARQLFLAEQGYSYTIETWDG